MKKSNVVGAVLGTVVFLFISNLCVREGSNKIMESLIEIPQK